MSKLKKLSNLELSNFFVELAMLTKSGMTVFESLSLMKDSTDIKSEKDFFEPLINVTSNGKNLSVALKENESFPNYAVKMTEIGEKTGHSDSVFKALGAYYKQSDELAESIKLAVAYPIVMLIIILAVIFVLFTLVMPVFNRVFTSLGAGSAQLLNKLLNTGYVLNVIALVLGGAVVLVLLFFVILSATKYGRARLDNLFNNSLVTRSLSEKLSAHRFAYAMSVMLSGGLSFDAAIELTLDIIKNKHVLAKIKKLRYLLDSGESFSDAVFKSEIFESSYTGMIAAAVRVGQIDSTLMVVAERYEENVKKKIFSVVSAVEPALVTVLSVIVGLVLMSVVVPLIGIMTTMI